MKEKRKGPIGRAAELAEGFAATVRRMQREREPRVLVYDETGYARLVQPDGRGYERLLETAERMVALIDEADAAPKRAPEQAPARRRSQPRAAEGEGQPSKRTGAQSKTKPRSAKRRAAGGKAADTSARKSASRSRPKRPAKGDG